MNFELQDGSLYWETNDVSACAAHFGVTGEDLIRAALFQSETRKILQPCRWILGFEAGWIGMVMN
jgi:hypothetical protein